MTEQQLHIEAEDNRRRNAARPKRSEDSSGKRTYEWRQTKYWSVTTILGGGLPKPALLPWGIKMVAEGACDLANELPALVAKDRDAAVRMLKGLPYANRDRAADLGTLIHGAVEVYALGKPFPTWPLEAKPRMGHFQQFLHDFNPIYEMAEAAVYNRTEAYAGTLDAIVTMAGKRWLLDVKTSAKGVYPDVALQLAAYRYAEFVGAPDGSEVPMPEVDGACVLHLNDQGYQMIEVRADEQVFLTFKFVREVFKWQQDTSKTVLLPDMRPATEVTA